MKKVMRKLVFIVLLMIFPIIIKAYGNITASPSSLTIEVGSSKTFNIYAVNTVGDVSISSSNSSVASVNSSYWATGTVDEGQTKTGSITVTGLNVGTSTITLTIDAATFDEENLSGQVRTVVVNVVEKKVTPTPSITPVNPNLQTGNNQNKSEEKDDKSTNNNLKELSIDGYEIIKVDNNNYTLVVSNDVSSINVKAILEDTKAKVAGDGKRELNVGENNIEITVTSESGIVNKYNIKVTRKDAFYLEDIDNVLKGDKKNVDININKDSKLSSNDLTKIKNSKKIVKLNYYDDNKKLIYSWILDGSKINDFDELLTGISFKSDKEKDIARLSNYADGIYIKLAQKSAIPAGVKLMIYVKDKYSDNDLVNIYYYDTDKLQIINKKLKVKDGYIEFDINKTGDYFVTMSNINNILVKGNKSSNVLLIIIIVLSILLVLLSFIFAFYLFKRKKKERANNIYSNSQTYENDNINR